MMMGCTHPVRPSGKGGSRESCLCLPAAVEGDLLAGQMPSLNLARPVATLQRWDRSGWLSSTACKQCDPRITLYWDGPEEDEPQGSGYPQTSSGRGVYSESSTIRFATALRLNFGDPIVAIFTDEPGLLGRSRETGIIPGTTGILEQVQPDIKL